MRPSHCFPLLAPAVTALFCCCGGNTSGNVDLFPGDPQLLISSDSLNFGIAGSERSLLISNTGKGDLHWNFDALPPWLSAEPHAGVLWDNQTETAKISLLRSLLEPGVWDTCFFVLSNGGTRSISVASQQSELPVLGELPATLDYGAQFDTLLLTIINAGKDLLLWSAFCDSDYFDVTPDAGTTEEHAIIQVYFNRTNPPVGYCQSLLHLNSNGGNALIHLRAYSGVGDSRWLSYFGEEDGYHVPDSLETHFAVRFDRPIGWQYFNVIRIRMLLSAQDPAPDDLRLLCWAASDSAGSFRPDPDQMLYQTGALDPENGWNEWTMTWRLGIPHFCVGFQRLSSSENILPRPAYDNTNPQGRSFSLFTLTENQTLIIPQSDLEWCLRIYVETSP